EDDAVFGDEAMSGVNKVGTRLPGTRRGVGVGRQAARRLCLNQRPPVFLLAENLGTGREVDQKGRTAKSEAPAWRTYRPEVLAEFDPHQGVGESFGGKEQIAAEGDFLPPPSKLRFD